ncbi:hypothetical protein GCK72_008821 [Caenorhabditis remanei]|uniref:Protein kinase domain-containing protein n=1 Tax=Caenorhabditis remanei TaxID=31234 RepID=A0A6A5H277_CAERE|nr:hypothetical protein GCK72_008821 [Caenorhabditis remanei]KAF1760572.1 hypothetical protein GCK72_008821 [Caenorhabditis remanei]
MGEGLECTTRLKSYAINLNGGIYSVQGSTTDAFPTLEALCESYIQTKQPLPAGGMLLKGVIHKPWQLFLCDVELPEPEILLGSGEFGKVVKGKFLKPGVGPIDVAIKMATDLKNAEITSEIYTEARVMRALIHPNIIRLEGVVVEKIPVMLVIEFMEGSSLLDALLKKRVPNEMRFPICMAVLYAVLHMHINSYIHRDIAARNGMVSHDCRTVKLIDFGLAKHGTQFILNNIGKIPVKRLPPEVLRTKRFSTKSDTWALAICF